MNSDAQFLRKGLKCADSQQELLVLGYSNTETHSKKLISSRF